MQRSNGGLGSSRKGATIMHKRKVFGIVPFALAMSLAGATAGYAAEPAALEASPDQLQVGMGIICDTESEMTRFVQIIGEQDTNSAIQIVNREASNPIACGMATVAFKVSKKAGDIRNSKGTYKIMEIDIVAAASNDGNWRLISPRKQFTAVKLDGYDV
jgi:hypothetical protein